MPLFQLTKLRYPEDCRRIQQALLAKGYVCSLKKAQKIWEARSEAWCAGWLGLPETDDLIWEELRDFVCGTGDD